MITAAAICSFSRGSKKINERPVIKGLLSAIYHFFHQPDTFCQPEPFLGSFVRFLVVLPVDMPASESIKTLKKLSNR